VVGLATSSNLREVRAIAAMGYPMLTVSDDTLEEIQAAIAKIGERIGRPNQARDLVGSIRSAIDSVQIRLANTAPRKVLMLVGHQPIVAVGPGTFLDQILKLAGGINIADHAAQQWPRLSIEYIMGMAPEVILDGQMGTDPGTPGGFWSQYQSIPAVRGRRVYGYPQDLMLHPGPRVSQSLEMIAAMLHPESERRRNEADAAATIPGQGHRN
jgi:iron complex transport system substrate-binding protein